MRLIRFSIVILVLIMQAHFALAAEAPSLPLEKSFQEAKDDYSKLKSQRDPIKWQALAQRFMALYNSQPQSSFAPKCLFWAGRINGEAYDKFKRPEDMSRAIGAYDQLINRFPSSSLADDAQYNKAELYKTKGDLQQAYLEFLKVTVDFPKGDMKPRAVQQLNELEKTFARQNRPAGQSAINTPPATGAPPASAGANKINEIRQWSVPGYARVVLNLNGPAPYSSRLIRSGLDGNGEKSVQLDLRRVQLANALKPIKPDADGLLKGVQYSSPKQDEVKVVITLKDLTSYKVFTLDNPFRLVVDCYSGEPPALASASATPAAPSAPAAPPEASGNKPSTPTPPTTYQVPRGRATTTPDQIGLAAQLGLHIRTVVIDPGHGGKDPGAINGKLREKDITLDIAKRVAAKLKSELNCTVLLTREKDVFLPLEDRTAFANTKGADLFISIHVNSAADSGLNGIETYFLNLATDEAAMRVAARENATTQRSLSDLQVILNDLMLNSKVNESNRLARIIHQQLLRTLRTKYKVTDLKVKQAPFYVLIGARMPAVLCEVGFLSHSTERSRLINKTYLNLLAEGIAKGVVNYAKELHQGATK